MKRVVAIAILIIALFGTVALPSAGGTAHAAPAKSHPAFLDKIRFLGHMGVAYYAFHHFVWAKWKAGDFKSGAPHRTRNIVKAAIAILFTYHEVRVAYGIAQKSHSKTLHLLVAPINALIGAANRAYQKMKSGNWSDSTWSALNNSVTHVGDAAKAAGYGIKDIPVKVPGA